MSNKIVLIKKSLFYKNFLAATCSFVRTTFRLSGCESVTQICPKNALFYKNIIRNDKLRKLTSEDVFKNLIKYYEALP